MGQSRPLSFSLCLRRKTRSARRKETRRFSREELRTSKNVPPKRLSGVFRGRSLLRNYFEGVGRRVPSPPCALHVQWKAGFLTACRVLCARRAGDCPPYPGPANTKASIPWGWQGKPLSFAWCGGPVGADLRAARHGPSFPHNLPSSGAAGSRTSGSRAMVVQAGNGFDPPYRTSLRRKWPAMAALGSSSSTATRMLVSPGSAVMGRPTFSQATSPVSGSGRSEGAYWSW